MDLLWENATSGDPFAAQTLSLGLSAYDYVVVAISQFGNASNGICVFYVLIPDNTVICTVSNLPENASTLSMRKYKWSGDDLIIYDGYFGTSVNQSRCNPLKIYGVKL